MTWLRHVGDRHVGDNFTQFRPGDAAKRQIAAQNMSRNTCP